jgi:hypothetical protein
LPSRRLCCVSTPVQLAVSDLKDKRFKLKTPKKTAGLIQPGAFWRFP